ncbi:MAG: hypothetical protein R3F54_18845 [Alphaproteobacteria bacterium]
MISLLNRRRTARGKILPRVAPDRPGAAMLMPKSATADKSAPRRPDGRTLLPTAALPPLGERHPRHRLGLLDKPGDHAVLVFAILEVPARKDAPTMNALPVVAYLHRFGSCRFKGRRSFSPEPVFRRFHGDHPVVHMARQHPRLRSAEAHQREMSSMKRFAIVGLFALSACSLTPPVDPAAQAALTQWNAGVQTSSATYADHGLRHTPPVVGSWAEYRAIDDSGQVSRALQKVVGEEAGAYWIESENQAPSGTTVVKSLIFAADWSQPGNIDIRRSFTQSNGGEPRELPVAVLGTLPGSLASNVGFSVSPGANGPVETVAVPAGRFEARKGSSEGIALPFIGNTSTTAWFNAAVPVSGVVKTETANGYRSELVAFGDSGAESVMPLP